MGADDVGLRDYFAAHAPQPIPSWFLWTFDETKPTLPSFEQALEQQPGYAQLAKPHKILLQDWLGTGSWDLHEDLAPIGAGAVKVRRDAAASIEAWTMRREIAKLCAWRWFYAEQMLATRPLY